MPCAVARLCAAYCCRRRAAPLHSGSWERCCCGLRCCARSLVGSWAVRVRVPVFAESRVALARRPRPHSFRFTALQYKYYIATAVFPSCMPLAGHGRTAVQRRESALYKLQDNLKMFGFEQRYTCYRYVSRDHCCGSLFPHGVIGNVLVHCTPNELCQLWMAAGAAAHRFQGGGHLSPLHHPGRWAHCVKMPKR